MKPGDLVRCTSNERLWTADPNKLGMEIGTSRVGDLYLYIKTVPNYRSHANVLHPKLGIVRMYRMNFEVVDETR